MQWTGIAANEQPAALDERSQLGQIELAEVQHPLSRWTECLPGRGRNARRRLTIGWSRTEHDPPARRRRQCRNDRRKCGFRPASKRIAGADMDHHQLVSGSDACCCETTLDVSLGLDIRRHLHGIPFGVRPAGGPPVNRFQQVPLVHDRVPPPQFARPRHGARIHPRPAGNLVADSLGGSREPGQPRTARPAVQIDHQIVMIPPQASRQPEIVRDPRETGRARRDDHFVQVRIPSDDGQCRRFHQICEVRPRKPALQRPKHRRRKDDVADEAQANQENFHGSRTPVPIGIA